jgi:esterase/lipase
MKFLKLSFDIRCLIALVLVISSGNSFAKIRPQDPKGRLHALETDLITQDAPADTLVPSSEDSSIRWFYSNASQDVRGIALVIHGLNLRPDKMESIITMLTDSGIDALNLSLLGHGKNYSHRDGIDTARARLESFKKASYQLWIDEIYKAYKAAKNRSDHRNVPLFFVGYSLGGLIGLDLFASRPEIKFDRMVLFAPALKMHLRNYLLRVLSPFPRLTIPSFTLMSYQSNAGTPMAAYNALFESYKHFHQNMNLKINVPTVIFIDKKDEIVSFKRLKKMVEKQELDQWAFHIVQKGKSGDAGRIHHLIIDELSTGKDVWKEMMDVMIKHLL